MSTMDGLDVAVHYVPRDRSLWLRSKASFQSGTRMVLETARLGLRAFN